jgi:hypothetical protein
MRWISLLLLAAATVANANAWSGSTRDFLERCESDQAWCATEIGEARRAVERGVEARKKICIPQGTSDEDLTGPVTTWIAEQVPSLDYKPAAESIAAAIVSLYGCDRPQGLEGIDL